MEKERQRMIEIEMEKMMEEEMKNMQQGMKQMMEEEIQREMERIMEEESQKILSELRLTDKERQKMKMMEMLTMIKNAENSVILTKSTPIDLKVTEL